MADLADAVLYGIIDLGYVVKDDAPEVARSLLKGGVDILQLRAKGCQPNELMDLAVCLRTLCESFGKPFVVNDHLELARDSAAHGLHLGQDDGDLKSAREQLPPHVFVGRSTHSVEQARAALEEGADYIGFGPLFPTPTKAGRPAIGLKDISCVQASVGNAIPVFCIGGIQPENLDDVLSAGARRCVIVSHLLQAESPGAEAAKARSIISNQTLKTTCPS